MSEMPNLSQTVCYRHPDRETLLRCSRCDRYICTSCAVLTPTGYRCPECIRGQQKVYETSQWWDYPLAFFLAGLISLLGSWVAQFMGFFTIFIAPVAGFFIAEAVRWAVRKRRSRLLFRVAAVAAALGGLPIFLVTLLSLIMLGGAGGSILSLVWSGLYMVLVTSSTYYRLSGIQV